MKIPLCIRPLVVATCLHAPSVAQLDLQWENGVLGESVRYSLLAPAPGWAAFLPATTSGPTPLALIDPFDPRQLAVGLDLLDLLQIAPLGPGAEIELALPADPVLAGVELHAQAVELFGPTSFFGALSPSTSFVVGAPGQTFPVIGGLAAARMLHTSTRLADGRVLIAGGHAPGSPLGLVTALEIYDPQRQSFQSSQASLSGGRAGHSATLLQDGRVLLLGGYGVGGTVLSGGLIYDPATDSSSPVSGSGAARIFHSATVLSDGRVLVAGGAGAYTASHPIGFPAAFAPPMTRRCAIFDPATNQWSGAPDLPRPRCMHATALLLGDEVLLVGGVELDAGGQPQTTDSVQLFSARDFDWRPGPKLPGGPTTGGHTPRPNVAGVGSSSTLFLGGAAIDFAQGRVALSAQALRFSQASESWSVLASMPSIVSCMDVECVPGPTTVYFGSGGLSGLELLSGAATANNAILRYDADLDLWSISGTSTAPRMGSDFSLVDDGRRMLISGAAIPGFPADPGADVHINAH